MRVITGAPSASAGQIVRDFLAGVPVTAGNACDHGARPLPMPFHIG